VSPNSAYAAERSLTPANASSRSFAAKNAAQDFGRRLPASVWGDPSLRSGLRQKPFDFAQGSASHCSASARLRLRKTLAHAF
jgi:hypothetical protein